MQTSRSARGPSCWFSTGGTLGAGRGAFVTSRCKLCSPSRCASLFAAVTAACFCRDLHQAELLGNPTICISNGP